MRFTCACGDENVVSHVRIFGFEKSLGREAFFLSIKICEGSKIVLNGCHQVTFKYSLHPTVLKVDTVDSNQTNSLYYTWMWLLIRVTFYCKK